MLFDKTPDEILSDDPEARARRLREEQEARDRLQQEIEEGRRRRQEQRDVARRFREKGQDATPVGRAKAAIESGDRVFQLVLPLPLEGAETGQAPAGHNPVLNAIEAQGWRLAQASYVSRAPGASSDVAAAGEPLGNLVAIYVFRRSI
jgi:hypothetical protein